MGGTTIVRSETAVCIPDAGVRPRSEEVRAQLARLLASPLFHHSRHYPSLLRYVVNETLEGRGSHLKERALGVEVFGRDADYDTNADPVVRTSACEVRKRIAQYYHEAGHEHELRIELSAGTYVPEFRFAAAVPLTLAPKDPPAAPILSRARQVPAHYWIVAAVAVSATILAAGTLEMRNSPSAVESFWGPVWGANSSIMMGLGGLPAETLTVASSGEDAGPSFEDVMRRDRLAFSDAVTMARLSGLIGEYGKQSLDIRRASAFTLTDLRKGPVILVGAFNNSWTLRLNRELRFTYEWSDASHSGMIRDRQNPSNRSWIYNPSIPYSKLAQDYAVVSRFVNPLTEKMVVLVAGLGRDGTVAAGEFVTNPRYLENLARLAPAHWNHKNLQVLLATDIVRGNTGPPRILATYFW